MAIPNAVEMLRGETKKLCPCSFSLSFCRRLNAKSLEPSTMICSEAESSLNCCRFWSEPADPSESSMELNASHPPKVSISTNTPIHLYLYLIIFTPVIGISDVYAVNTRHCILSVSEACYRFQIYLLPL